MMERGRRANRLAADVAAMVQARHDVGQPDRIDVEHGRGVRIIADAPGIAGDEQQIAQAHGVRAEQVGLDAEQIPIAAGVVQQRFDARLLFDQHRQRQARSAARRREGRRGC